jgi:hypothetical protein
MKRTTGLKKSSSAYQIRSAVCLDSRNATGPQIDAAVEYMFAWHEWKVSGLSYKSIMNTYYNGEWKSFCLGGPQQSNSATEGKLSKATKQSWSRWLNGPTDLFPVTYTIGRLRWYVNSNEDCQAIEFEQASDAERAAAAYSDYYRFGSVSVLYVSSLNLVLFDNSFGNSCSKGIKAVYGGS